MKISVYGLKPFSELIKDGFEKLGHQTSSENVDLIYANDPRGYEKSLILKKQNPNALLIFNLLDVQKMSFTNIIVTILTSTVLLSIRTPHESFT